MTSGHKQMTIKTFWQPVPKWLYGIPPEIVKKNSTVLLLFNQPNHTATIHQLIRVSNRDKQSIERSFINPILKGEVIQEGIYYKISEQLVKELKMGSLNS